MYNEKSVTDQLDSFFSGLEAGLNSLREVRETYDEEVAFDFNPLQLFQICENSVTGMLTYFLDPMAKHGQKDRLLRAFLQQIGAQLALNLLDQSKAVKVSTQYFTTNGRPVDAVITFGDNDFIIGIENKVWGAVDQREQISDYIADIEQKAKGGEFQMLYLSNDGTPPSKESIDPQKLAEFEGRKRFKVIPFCGSVNECTILSILKALSDAARADSVRSFIKLMITYFEKHFSGGTTVDEQKFVDDYVKRHPEVIEHRVAIDAACDKIYEEYIDALINHFITARKWKKRQDRTQNHCVELFLNDTPVWREHALPVVISLQLNKEIRSGIIRIGVWSNEHKVMEPLFKLYQAKHVCDAKYEQNDAWEGGYFEAQANFIRDQDVVDFFKNKALPSFERTFNLLELYVARLTEICTQT